MRKRNEAGEAQKGYCLFMRELASMFMTPSLYRVCL